MLLVLHELGAAVPVRVETEYWVLVFVLCHGPFAMRSDLLVDFDGVRNELKLSEALNQTLALTVDGEVRVKEFVEVEVPVSNDPLPTSSWGNLVAEGRVRCDIKKITGHGWRGGSQWGARERQREQQGDEPGEVQRKSKRARLKKACLPMWELKNSGSKHDRRRSEVEGRQSPGR
jgi:hypothetical protein